MAIKIPSRNIYEKSHQKVLDNVVEKIEIGVKEIKPLSKYNETAYEDDFTYAQTQEAETSDWVDDDFTHKDVGDVGGLFAFVACKVVSTEYYRTIERLVVPKSFENKRIKKAIGLSYSINATKKTYNCTGTFTAQPTAGSGGHYFSDSFSLGEQTGESSVSGSLFEAKISTDVKGLPNTETNGLSAEATISPTDKSNLPDERTEDENSYIFEGIKVLAKKTVLKLKSRGDAAGFKGQATKWEAEGEYVEYIPDSINLSVNGNFVTINITDTDVVVGDVDGKKSFAISSNELLQKVTDASPAEVKNNSVENRFETTKKEYEKGKETASIRCSISDYYDYSTSEPLISISGFVVDVSKKITASFNSSGGETTVTVSTAGSKKYPYPIDVVVELKLLNSSLIRKTTATIKPNTTTLRIYVPVGTEKIESYTATAKLKMCFDEYDTVIPMVYGADGVDRPMSYKKDGTPKEFMVVGTRIFYDGAVWQELYLQET